MEARWGEVQILPYKKYENQQRLEIIQYMHSRNCISQPQNVISKPTSCLTFFLNNASPAGNNLIPVLGLKAANDNHFHFV